MSQRYKGAVISATPPTVSATSPNNYGTAKGVWTLQQQMQYEGAGTWPSPFAPTYIEDVFSTYLYTGNNSTQNIINGIDLLGNGGLVWTKVRSTTDDHELIDTVRGRAFSLESNTTDGESTSSVGTSLTQFNSNGYSLGTNGSANVNENAQTFVSWTFRKQPKFFDVVTYTGSNSDQTISHNLGSTPGCIMIKKLDSNTFNAGWAVYHRSLTNPSNYYLVLNTTAAETNYGGAYISSVNSSTFTVAGGAGSISIAGSTYVAYLFAHNAGGFGDSGSENVISCGSFTTPSSGLATIELGYEPQWLMVKCSSNTGDWWIVDNMRGFSQTFQARLDANASWAEETTTGPWFKPTATGFTASADSIGGSRTHIYIAIRRGPMKTPTLGTEVFSPNAITGDSLVTTNFPVDSSWLRTRTGTTNSTNITDRLRGSSQDYYNNMQTPFTSQENTGTGAGLGFDNNTGYKINGFTGPSASNITWNFRRAPGFFDTVCYTGTGSATTVTHNLRVAPELIIVKRRNASGNWLVYSLPTGNSSAMAINSTTDAGPNGAWNYTTPTSTVFSLLTDPTVNAAGSFYVAYLFASVSGVSKVGSYTGTATTQQIDCGFTSGSRFVMIKRTDASGSWYIWDSARGIVAGNDPYLLLNATTAEVSTTDYIDTYTQGFEITSTAPDEINASGGTYLYLAIA